MRADIESADIAAIILAGGRGLRMGGADKGLLPYRQRPLIEWVFEAVQPQVSEVLISANRNLEVYAKYGHRVLRDTLADFSGPLAGVLTAMEAVNTEWLLVVPCDTPYLPGDLVRCLARAARTADVPIAIAKDATQMHYSTMLVQARLADPLRDYLNSGQRAVHRWQQAFNPAHYIFPQSTLVNVNTPADLMDKPCA